MSGECLPPFLIFEAMRKGQWHTVLDEQMRAMSTFWIARLAGRCNSPNLWAIVDCLSEVIGGAEAPPPATPAAPSSVTRPAPERARGKRASGRKSNRRVERIVRIADFGTAKKAGAIVGVERPVVADALGQVRIGDKVAAESD